MSSGREILTLQFGHYSNFVGTHWWNIQELGFSYNENTKSEINHDVLYREGITDKGKVTFTPRLLIADLKGSLKSLSNAGNLYEDEIPHDEIDPLWSEGIEIQSETPIVKNEFQQSLDRGDSSENPADSTTLHQQVEVWSDFLYSRFHPRTINIVNEFEIDCKSKEFDSFPLGEHIWKVGDYADEFTDKIRMYIEECDNFQGFHVLLDSTNAFCGLATSCIEYIHDEYDPKSIFALPIMPTLHHDVLEDEKDVFKVKESIKILNLTHTFVTLADEASIFSPLSVCQSGWRQAGPAIAFNHLNYDFSSRYETSAILASALDTFTMKYRSKSSHYLLSDLAADLTSFNRKAVAASLCLPFAFNQDADFIECLDNWEGPLTQSITPNCKIGNYKTLQAVHLRGIPETRLKQIVGKQKDLPAYKCNSVAEVLNMFYSFSSDACATNVTTIEQGLCVKTPFPSIFSTKIGCNGEIGFDLRPETIGVDKVPVLAGLHTGSEMGECLESLHTETRRIKIARLHQFCENGFGRDEFEENLDKLFSLRENYDDNYLL